MFKRFCSVWQALFNGVKIVLRILLTGVEHLVYSFAQMDAEKEFVGGYVDGKLKLALEKIAQAEDRSMNYIIEKFLMQGVKQRQRRRRPVDAKEVKAA